MKSATYEKTLLSFYSCFLPSINAEIIFSNCYSYYVDAISGSCLSERVQVLASVDTMPIITETTPGIRCGTGKVILKATTDIGTLNWYSFNAGGTSIGIGTSFATPSISSSKPFYVAAINGQCTTERVSVNATVNPAMDLSTTSNGKSIMANYEQLHCSIYNR